MVGEFEFDFIYHIDGTDTVLRTYSDWVGLYLSAMKYQICL